MMLGNPPSDAMIMKKRLRLRPKSETEQSYLSALDRNESFTPIPSTEYSVLLYIIAILRIDEVVYFVACLCPLSPHKTARGIIS